MAKFLPVNEFWSMARSIMTRLWNRWAKVNSWPKEDWEFERDMKDLAALCRGDQEKKRFKFFEERAYALIGRYMWKDEQNAKQYRENVKTMNEEDWNYAKRVKAVLRISDYWINKGEDPKIVDEWIVECMNNDWSLDWKYEDFKEFYEFLN